MTKKPVLQGGVQNYLGKQKQVTAPVKWKSSPDHPETELAYITKAEKNLLIEQDLHGSLKGGVNKGPSGIMSLNGFGSADESQNVSGAAASAAESGKNTSDTLAEGMSAQDVKDFQAASVAAGAGQRVNPGFFDSRNRVDPDVLAAARNISPAAFKATRGGGLLGLISGGGFFGNLVRNLGQKFGLGKTYDQPTYDMSRLSGLPYGGSAAFENLDIRDKFDRRGNLIDDDEEEQNVITGTAYPGANINRVSPNVNLLAQPVYSLDGSVRDDDAFGYFDLPDGYFDTNTNTNRSIKDEIVPGGILDNVDLIDMQENDGFGPMA